MTDARDSTRAEHWHPRLHKSIVVAQCGIESGDRQGDACAFARWLNELEEAGRPNPRAAELHRQFHIAAARILDIAQSGRKPEALALLSAEGEYAGIFSDLMLEMQGWQKREFPWYDPFCRWGDE